MSRILLTLLTLPLAAGCNSQTGVGNVLATVNGEPVTPADVMADFAARDLPAEAGMEQVSPAMLAAMVDRRLLAERARAEGVDTEPGYAAMAARAQEITLAQRLLAKWRIAIPSPSRDSARLFVDRNPQMFADRVIYLLRDVETVAKGLDVKALEPLHSMEAVEEHLRQHDRPFQRGSASLDTMTLDLPGARRIAALSTGEPFAATRGTGFLVRSVVRTTPAPVVGNQALQIATGMLRQKNYELFVQQQIETLRNGATITYPSASPPV